MFRKKCFILGTGLYLLHITQLKNKYGSYKFQRKNLKIKVKYRSALNNNFDLILKPYLN